MPLFMPAPERLSQLALNGFEEEQYDLAITCMHQMANLGRHPSGDLLRNLVAISLCSLPRQSGSKKGSAIARPMSRKTMERIAPTATMVLDARGLLEKLGKQGLFDEIFDAILPVLSSKGSGSDLSKNKRSRSEYENDSGGEDFANSTDSSPIGQFNHKMVECQNIWQIMALGDMMDKSEGKGGRKGSKSRGGRGQEEREGEESIRSNDVFDREGVWAVLEVLLQCWKNEDRKRQTTSHYAEQFIEAPHRNRKPRKDRVPSTYMGEAFDVIYAGLSPTSLMDPKTEEDGKSAKNRKNEEYKRNRIAISLLKQMFHLAKDRHLDKAAVLRATAGLLEKVNTSGMLFLGFDMRRDFEYEWVEAVILALGTTQGKEQDDLPMQDYQDCLAELRTIKKMPKATMTFLKDINDGAWLKTVPRHDHEMALIEFYDGHHDKKEVASFAKNSSIKALLADKWKMGSASGKNGSTAARTTDMTWEQLCFAVIWRRVTMQAELKNIELKMQVHQSVCQTHGHTKGIPSSVKAWKKLTEICEAAILEPAAEKAKMIKECCTEMEKSYKEHSKGDESPRGSGRGRDNDEDTDSQDNEDEDDDVNWKKDMRRHLDACAEISNELAEQVRMHKNLNERKEKRTTKKK